MRKNILKDQDIASFEFQIARTEPLHLHQNIELFYLLEGEAELTVGENLYHLKPGDIIVINSNKKHGYRSQGDVLIAYFEINYLELCDLLNTNQLLFWCNSVLDKNTAFLELHQVMKQIFNQYSNESAQARLVLKGYYYQLLRILTENFQVGSGYAEFLGRKDAEEDRQEKIANYIAMNYNKRISLKEIADNLFISIPYLSKYIKNRFGMNFSDYLSDVRMLHALDDLLYTDKTIMSIALSNGFASANAFNDFFKKKYRQTPSEYRRQKFPADSPDSVMDTDPTEKNERVDDYLRKNAAAVTEEMPRRKMSSALRVDARDRNTYEQTWKMLINIGRAADLLRSDMQEHVRLLAKELGFRAVRIWDIFGPELMINESSKDGNFNFEKLDKVLDFLTDIHVVPYLELGYKPNSIHRTLQNQLIHEKRIIQFGRRDETKRFFSAFIHHLVNRYGIEEVEKWYFEQWSGEELERDGPGKYFFSVFNALYETVKSVSDKIKVGGPGIGIQYGNANLMGLIEGWEKQPYQPDFISLYCYPYIKGDEDGSSYAKISSDRDFLKNQLIMATNIIKASSLRLAEIHVSEWSFTVSNRNVLNDSCYKGAYTLKNIFDSMTLTNALGYWIGSDIFAEYYDKPAVLFGGCGLLSKDGIKKPSYYAYYFANQMKKYMLAKEDNYMVTSDSHDNYYVLFHNYRHLNYKYYLKAEDEQDIYRLYQIYEDSQIRKVHMELAHVKNGRYKVKSYSINEQSGSVLEEWKHMNLENNLSKQETAYLKQISVPRIQMKEYLVDDFILRFEIELLPQEIQYIHISYLYEEG